MQKTIALAGNDTALRAKFADFESHHKEKGNETGSDIEDKIAKFKAGAAKAQTKLDELMSNSTLMGTCQSLAKGEAFPFSFSCLFLVLFYSNSLVLT